MNDMDIQLAKDTIRKHRVITNFNKRYADRGGVDQLMRMVRRHDTIKEMCDWFGLAQSRISTILSDVLDMNYSEYLANQNISRSGIIGDKHENS